MSGTDDRPALLFVCHRIPYPPDKGDKIRSWHLLSALARHYRVHLATFVDDPADLEHRAVLDRVCERARFAPLTRARLAARWLRALVSGRALSVASYADRDLARTIGDWVEEAGIERVVVFSAGPVALLPPTLLAGGRTVVDFVDVDSEKWREYAAGRPRWTRWLFAREARRLLEHERRTCEAAAASVFVSDAEARLFVERSGAAPGRVHGIGNGVDHGFFDPAAAFDDPYGPGVRAAVFTGAMDYAPNVEAVTWFAREVLPTLLARDPTWRFAIVGHRPARAVSALAREPGCIVTGSVADVRPWLRHAEVAVAPMRIARGVQNKVLEAMSMGLPVVASPQALEGLGARAGLHCTAAETPGDYVRALVDTDGAARAALGAAARRFVVERVDWAVRTDAFVRLVEGAEGGTMSAAADGLDRGAADGIAA